MKYMEHQYAASEREVIQTQNTPYNKVFLAQGPSY